ncbi:MAG: hypothetical protein CVT73_05860 [Alphaproteobacteria bacterium HGW-Alphaproteobacteria-12]|nr:MAG: hypothetical protein CVT73_05860 [Alphaproteobacteria bacterium HGW-Alphaproteobacteria-12]
MSGSADDEASAEAAPIQPDEGATYRIVDLVLDERTVMRRSPDVEHERKVAIFDLLEENSFTPVGSDGGPYVLHLSIEENRLVFDIRLESGDLHGKMLLSLTPFRRIIKDYFMICESYYDAIKTAAPAQIEAIDMGRRGLHNEGSELLKERLAGKIGMDFDTARRLFTLICVLHIKG